jgi:cytochrome c2
MSRTFFSFAGLAIALASMLPAADADPEKGNEVFDEQCAQCHHAYKDEKKAGPSLKWLFSRDKLESNGKPVSEGSVLEMVERGGRGMPAFKGTLSDEDKADLIAYLKTL